MVLIRVDLPAPLSPASATTSPRRSASETSSSACTPPNFLLMLRTSSRLAPGSTMTHPPVDQPLLALVDHDRDDDDDAHGNELPEWLDIDEDQPVLDDGNDQGADDGPDHR